MNIGSHQDLDSRVDIFEPGDLTALVCVEHPEMQQQIVQQLASMDYKLHVGLFAEDISLKLKTHVYDVVVIDEHFGGCELSTNAVLYEATHLPGAQRRLQYFVLVGDNVQTNDEMMAFILSVDLVVNVADLENFKPVLRRGAARQKEFYQPYLEVSKAAGMA